jgi:hypothetical protein
MKKIEEIQFTGQFKLYRKDTEAVSIEDKVFMLAEALNEIIDYLNTKQEGE